MEKNAFLEKKEFIHQIIEDLQSISKDNSFNKSLGYSKRIQMGRIWKRVRKGQLKAYKANSIQRKRYKAFSKEKKKIFASYCYSFAIAFFKDIEAEVQARYDNPGKRELRIAIETTLLETIYEKYVMIFNELPGISKDGAAATPFMRACETVRNTINYLNTKENIDTKFQYSFSTKSYQKVKDNWVSKNKAFNHLIKI